MSSALHADAGDAPSGIGAHDAKRGELHVGPDENAQVLDPDCPIIRRIDHGASLTRVAVDATLHCLTGCAIGEIAGMIVSTAAGLSNGVSIALSIVLAFVFGYSLTSLPLLRAGMALAAVVPIALASDTLSIATMEAVDNAIVAIVPGALNAGLGDLLFWGSLTFALAVAGAFAVPVNRWLIARGRGHAVVHETGIHGGPSPRVVGAVAAAGFAFGLVVLLTAT